MRRALIVLLTLMISISVFARATADDAADTARKLTGGRVVSVEHSRDGERELWRVKVVTDRGEVKVIYIDVETGKPT